MLNSDFIVAQSHNLAERLTSASDEQRIEALYLRTLGRPPREAERRDATQFLSNFPVSADSTASPQLAWAALSQVLLGSGEFRYVY
jgi:hypothetical protein